VRALEGQALSWWGPLKGRGQFAFRTPSKGWLRVLPVDGDTNLLPSAETVLNERKTKPLSRLVVVRDEDAMTTDAVGATLSAASDQRARLESWAGNHVKAQHVPGTRDFVLGGGLVETRISFLIWAAPDADAAHLPAKQTLERLVCAAIAEAHGPRCKNVADFIASRSAPPSGEKLHKTHAAAHMAGWYSDRGYEGLFGAVWDDAAIRDALLRRLDKAGATPILDALLGA
jgi:hypothetical protein